MMYYGGIERFLNGRHRPCGLGVRQSDLLFAADKHACRTLLIRPQPGRLIKPGLSFVATALRFENLAAVEMRR